MTMDITLDPPRQARPADAVTNRFPVSGDGSGFADRAAHLPIGSGIR